MREASLEMERISAAVAKAHPEQEGWGARLQGFESWLVGPVAEQRIWALSAAVGLLLLMASANVASLLVARAAARRREVGIRASLGAGRPRLMRQMLTESALLALLGGGGGFLLASWMVPWLLSMASDLPRLQEVALDGWTLLFTSAISLATLLIFGLAPARESLREDGSGTLRSAHVTLAPGGRLRAFLVAGQVALAVVVLIGAGLLARSLFQLRAVDPGFDSSGVLTVPLDLPWEQFTGDERRGMARELKAALESLPGVKAVGASASNPMVSCCFSIDVTPEDRVEEVGSGGLLQVGWRAITPDFFRSLGIPLLRGRGFESGDGKEGRSNVLLSRSLAEALWPGGDPLGQKIFMGGTDGEGHRVVGVVGDLRDRLLSAEPQPILYLPYEGAPMNSLNFFVRGEGNTEQLLPLLRQQVRALAPGLPVGGIVPMRENLSESVSMQRFQALLFSLFALLSLFLAAIGIFGLLAYLVAEREREIGIRRALGAGSKQLVLSLATSCARPLAAGLGLGALGAFLGGELLRSQLYGVEPSDPWTYGFALILLATVAILAALSPLRRALAIEPRDLCVGE